MQGRTRLSGSAGGDHIRPGASAPWIYIYERPMSMNAGMHWNDATGVSMLATYLHRHLIAGAAGERLFGHAAKMSKDSPHGETIARFADVSADKVALQVITEGLDPGW